MSKSYLGLGGKSKAPVHDRPETSSREVGESDVPLRKGLGWAPAFVAGFAAGASGTVAVALLLYTGEGLLRSLTLIVAIELGAFGLGLGVGGTPNDWSHAVESLRRRWLSALVAFLAGAGFALAWVLFAGFGALPMTQALGLALLGRPSALCVRPSFEKHKRRADDGGAQG